MTQTSYSAVALADGSIPIQEFELPEIGSNDGLLKVEITGVCGSDWPYYQSYPSTKGPLILGHETVGFVETAGARALEAWGAREGDLVALEEYLPCGHCSYCRGGSFRLCDATDSLLGAGLRYGSTPVSVKPSLWGGYGQYQYLHPNTVLHKVPDGVSPRLATLALPLGNGFEWTMFQGGTNLQTTVLIQGPGQQGLACVLAAKAAGAACIIVSGLARDRERLDLAKALGADCTINVEEEDIFSTISDVTGGEMPNLIIDCSSGGAQTFLEGLHLVRKNGLVLVCGRKARPIPEFDTNILFKKNITVKGLRGHSYEAVEMALSVLKSKAYPVERLCTHDFGLNEVRQALDAVSGNADYFPIHCTVSPRF